MRLTNMTDNRTVLRAGCRTSRDQSNLTAENAKSAETRKLTPVVVGLVGRGTPCAPFRGRVAIAGAHGVTRRFSIPTGLYPPAQGCEARATLGCVPEACSTLKGLHHGAGFWRAGAVSV